MSGWLDDSKCSEEEKAMLNKKCRNCGMTVRESMIYMFNASQKAYTCELKAGGHEF